MTFGLQLAIGVWLFGLVVVLLVVRYALRMKSRIAAAGLWPRTDAVIVRSGVRQVGKGGFLPGIVFSYQVGDRAFEGHRLTFGSRTGTSSFAQEIVDRHPVGKAVTVSYDPGDPGFAVLSPTGDPSAYFKGAWMLSAMFAFVGVVLLFVG